jgi:hypothetical protein
MGAPAFKIKELVKDKNVIIWGTVTYVIKKM